MSKRALFVTLTVLFTLFSCKTHLDEDGIFKDIDSEIELNDAVARGNIFDIVEAGGKLYAGGGKVYVKDNPLETGGWRIFSESPLSNGIVVRLAASGSTLTVECAVTGERKHFYTTSMSNVNWQPGGSISEKKAPTGVPEAIGGATCEAAGRLGKYYGTSSGAYYMNGGIKTPLPGTNTTAAIGNYYISAIYVKGDHVYVGTIGTGVTYGTKNNGIWAYHGDTWNRE
jgi:hypothetical protein